MRSISVASASRIIYCLYMPPKSSAPRSMFTLNLTADERARLSFVAECATKAQKGRAAVPGSEIIRALIIERSDQLGYVPADVGEGSARGAA